MYNNNNYLEHYGVPGMKWGRRRGTIQLSGPTTHSPRLSGPTTSGSTGGSGPKNTGSKSNKTNSNSQSNTNAGNKQKTNSKIDTKGLNDTKKMMDEVSKFENKKQAKQQAKLVQENKKNAFNDMSKMSDKELQQRVNRLNMEDRYVSLTEKRNVNQGKSNLQKTLDTAGTVLAYAGTALAIYNQIQDIRGRK